MTEQDIIRDAADIYGITISDMTSPKRNRRYADARAVVCYLLYGCMGMTCTEISDRLNRTHATVLYFNNRANEWLRTPWMNPRGAAAIRKLKQRYSKDLRLRQTKKRW